MKGTKKVFLGFMVLMLTFVNLFGINVYAAEESRELNASNLAGYDLLTDEAKLIVDQLCDGADSVTSYIPNPQVRLNSSNDSAHIMVTKTINKDETNGVISEDKVVTLIALAGSWSTSGQAYGVAASNTVSITWNYTKPDLSDLTVTFNSMTAKFTYLPTQSTDVTKMEFSTSLEPPVIGNPEYFASDSASYPSSGIPYTKVLNSAPYRFGAQNLLAMITLYYSNGQSSTYFGYC